MVTITDPSSLSSALVAALNAGNVETLVDLYEDDAVLELPDGSTARGRDEIRAYYAALVADRPRLEPGMAMPALIVDDLTLTTTQIGDSSTAEVARRQADGTWRWVIDRPDVRRVVRDDQAPAARE